MSIEIWVLIAGFIGSGVTAVINGMYTNNRRKLELANQNEFNHLDLLQKECRDLRTDQKQLRDEMKELHKENADLRSKIRNLEKETKEVRPLREKVDVLTKKLESIYTWYGAWDQEPTQHNVKCVMEAIKDAIDS